MSSRAQYVGAAIARPRAHSTSSGFSLVELMVVIGIIAIVLTMTVPVLSGARQSARRAQTAALVNTVSTAIHQFRNDNRRMPGVFSQEELASPSNTGGFSQMENAILDLAGGVDPTADVSADHVFELSLDGRIVRVNTRQISSAHGPGYLPLPFKGYGSLVPQANGLAVARPGVDQVIDLMRGTVGNVEMPDILDAWGRPIMLWMQNEYAGESPSFSRLYSRIDESDSSARFYWATNRGYLEAPAQLQRSAIGGAILDVKRRRSFEALLGDPASPDHTSGGVGSHRIPLGPRGDFVLHGSGRDGIFLSNGGDERMEYRYCVSGMEVSVSGNDPADRYWRTMDGVDDLIVGCN